MPISMLCSQCGSPAERCELCAGALCQRLLCSELHDAACAAVSALPSGPAVASAAAKPKAKPTRDTDRDDEAERLQAEQLVLHISQHRQAGRSALLIGDLDTAFEELWAARNLEPNLDHLGAHAREIVPHDWESETDLTPLARALSSRQHPHAADAWRRLLDDRPARSIQAEAAEWLARDAFKAGRHKDGLRMLHAASLLGRPIDSDAFHAAYKHAGLNAAEAFAHYLAASHHDAHTARAACIHDPLTDRLWSDQDPRWWLPSGTAQREQPDHQREALGRARDLVKTKRQEGWLLLAEGDLLAAPQGVRALGRSVRAGCAEAADHDAFVRIRLAYEGAADRLPDVAWPWYRLAELLAFAGFADRARDHLKQAEKRSLGSRYADREQRPQLRLLVKAGLGELLDSLAGATTRPFPAEPFNTPLPWRLGRR